MKKGFTLIELLVVVLIIGILAAIAVPQYQKAVLKSRSAEMLLINKALNDAQERYFLQNGEYTESFDDIDINVLPSTYKFCIYQSNTNIYSDGKDQISLGKKQWGMGMFTTAAHCPSKQQDFSIITLVPGFRICPATASSPCTYCAGYSVKGKALCKTMGSFADTFNGYDYYFLNK